MSECARRNEPRGPSARARWVMLLFTLLLACSARQTMAQETQIDGVGKIISAPGAQGFHLHRGANISGHYVRTGRASGMGEKQEVVWDSPPLPATIGTRVVFAWDTVVSGRYHLSGQFARAKEPFLIDVHMNGKKLITCETALKGDARFSIGEKSDPKHIELFFDYISTDYVKNVNGITYLSVPAALVTPGKPVRFKAVAKPHERVAFYAVVETTGVWAFAETVVNNPKTIGVPDQLKDALVPVPSYEETRGLRLPAAVTKRGFLLAEPEKQVRVVIVAGLTGNAEEKGIIQARVKKAHDLFRVKLRYPAERVHVLTPPEIPWPGRTAVTSRAAVRELFEKLAVEMTRDECLCLILLGHANRVGDVVMFNVPGPDLRAEQLNEMLNALPCRYALIGAFVPVSGAFVARLGRPGRIVISSCLEDQVYRSSFAEPFFDALVTPAADTDGNKVVSVLEAFWWATEDVRELYRKKGFVRGEQALLDDNGDGVGAPAPSRLLDDGKLAARLFLARPPPAR